MENSVCFGLAIILIMGQVGALPRNERAEEEWEQRGKMDAQNNLKFEEGYRKIAYDLEVILQQHLKTWNFLTETKTVFDEGEVIDKNWFLEHVNDVDVNQLRGNLSFPRNKNDIVIKGENSDGENGSPCNNFDKLQNIRSKKWKCKVRMQMNTNAENKTATERFSHTTNVKERKSVILRENERSYAQRDAENKTSTERFFPTAKVKELKSVILRENERSYEQRDTNEKKSRKERSDGIPIMYMPGEKKKRQCVAASGIFSGYNAMNYLSFITGILSLILNVNNNINNNNNNNNLNDNNDISNNNVDANSNSQTANQIVVFPPGRKRRSFADWLLQSVSLFSSATQSDNAEKLVKDDGGESTNSSSHHHIVDGMTTGLRLMVAAVLNDIDSTLKRNGYNIMNANIQGEEKSNLHLN